MPWRSMDPLDLKMRFVNDYYDNVFTTFSELCNYYTISRKTGYKWINRFRQKGIYGLHECSRKPNISPNKTPEYIEELILNERRKHKFWGPKKLYKPLRKHLKISQLPARSTMCNIIKRGGLITIKTPSRKRAHPGAPVSTAIGPMQLLSADFKGQFKTTNGFYCYPLTISDNYSRFLLACKGLLSPTLEDSKKVFERVFKEYGLPERIRTDNGNPFACTALGRLTRLSVWWIKLGIIPELIEPGKPQQNGIHERMHKTLKQETTIPPAYCLQSQQRKFNEFIHEYNFERPHESLNMKTPSELFTYSPRQMPSKLPEVDYPSHYETRLVSTNGGIRWKHNWVNVSGVLANEYIGLEELDYGLWDVYFGPVKLGRLIESKSKIIDNYIKKTDRECYRCP